MEDKKVVQEKEALLAKIDMLSRCSSVRATVYLAGALEIALPPKGSAAAEAKLQERLKRLQEWDDSERERERVRD